MKIHSLSAKYKHLYEIRDADSAEKITNSYPRGYYIKYFGGTNKILITSVDFPSNINMLEILSFDELQQLHTHAELEDFYAKLLSKKKSGIDINDETKGDPKVMRGHYAR